MDTKDYPFSMRRERHRFALELERGGLLFSDAMNVVDGMKIKLRGAIKAVEEGKALVDVMKLRDGTMPLYEQYETYVRRTNSDETDRAYILDHSDADAVREFDTLVDEYNTEILPAVEIGEVFWKQQGVRDGFLEKAKALLDKIEHFDKKASV